jgi:hypothetical protein
LLKPDVVAFFLLFIVEISEGHQKEGTEDYYAVHLKQYGC